MVPDCPPCSAPSRPPLTSEGAGPETPGRPLLTLSAAPKRLWNAADLKHVKTVSNGSSWITDCVYLPQARQAVLTSMDRAISTYDMNRRGGGGAAGGARDSGQWRCGRAGSGQLGTAGSWRSRAEAGGGYLQRLCASRSMPN